MRLGRIAGFELTVHWSTIFIFGLIVMSLGAVQLPDDAPGYSDGAYFAAALVAGAGFYVSLLAHELSHAVLARREGIEVEGLTLWLLGGVATLRGEARSPGADFRIAGVGPFVSLVLAAVFAAAAALVAAAEGPSLVQATLAWLGGINGVLAAFNLVPAAPLDGGRLLRAAIWHVRGDRTEAALWASRAGKVFGYVLIGLGVSRFLFGVGFGGLWFVLLGWFILNAARAEEAQTLLSGALGGLRARDVMTADPVTVPDDITVQRLVDEFIFNTRHSAFPTVNANGDVTGLVTLTHARSVGPTQREHSLVRDVFCTRNELTVASPDEPLVDILPRLNRCADGRILVLAGDHLVGLITATDVTRVLEMLPESSGAIRRVATGAGS